MRIVMIVHVDMAGCCDRFWESVLHMFFPGVTGGEGSTENIASAPQSVLASFSLLVLFYSQQLYGFGLVPLLSSTLFPGVFCFQWKSSKSSKNYFKKPSYLVKIISKATEHRGPFSTKTVLLGVSDDQHRASMGFNIGQKHDSINAYASAAP